MMAEQLRKLLRRVLGQESNLRCSFLRDTRRWRGDVDRGGKPAAGVEHWSGDRNQIDAHLALADAMARRAYGGEARPQSVSLIDWNLKPAFKDSMFKFVPPQGSTKVELVARKTK